MSYVVELHPTIVAAAKKFRSVKTSPHSIKLLQDAFDETADLLPLLTSLALGPRLNNLSELLEAIGSLKRTSLQELADIDIAKSTLRDLFALVEKLDRNRLQADSLLGTLKLAVCQKAIEVCNAKSFVCSRQTQSFS